MATPVHSNAASELPFPASLPASPSSAPPISPELLPETRLPQAEPRAPRQALQVPPLPPLSEWTPVEDFGERLRQLAARKDGRLVFLVGGLLAWVALAVAVVVGMAY